MAASYGAPGVYIEEQPSGSMPIEGVGTAVAAFVGFTERYDREQGDPTDPAGVKPQLVTSWPQYERVYGGFVRGAVLPHSVRGFFENGGSAAYICRIPGTNGSEPGGIPAWASKPGASLALGAAAQTAVASEPTLSSAYSGRETRETRQKTASSGETNGMAIQRVTVPDISEASPPASPAIRLNRREPQANLAPGLRGGQRVAARAAVPQVRMADAVRARDAMSRYQASRQAALAKTNANGGDPS